MSSRRTKNQKNKKKKHFSKLFCTNGCNVADMWTNCDELVKQWPNWMCSNKNSTDGIQRFQNCRGTCTCPDRIRN